MSLDLPSAGTSGSLMCASAARNYERATWLLVEA